MSVDDISLFFKVILPNDRFSVIIDQRDREGKLLFASQDGDRHDFTFLKNLMIKLFRINTQRPSLGAYLEA